jgi:hypothetical protein
MTFFGNFPDVMAVADNVSVNVLPLLAKDSLPTSFLDSKLGVVNLHPMSMTV